MTRARIASGLVVVETNNNTARAKILSMKIQNNILCLFPKVSKNKLQKKKTEPEKYREETN